MQVLLTKNELRRFFPDLDPRTVIARFALEADAIVMSGGHEVLVYRLDRIQEIAATNNSVSNRSIL